MDVVLWCGRLGVVCLLGRTWGVDVALAGAPSGNKRKKYVKVALQSLLAVSRQSRAPMQAPLSRRLLMSLFSRRKSVQHCSPVVITEPLVVLPCHADAAVGGRHGVSEWTVPQRL